MVGLQNVAASTIGNNGLPSTVTASNGNVYTITVDGGNVMATFAAPPPVMVGLGMSGESVSLQVAEDGSYWLGDMAVSGGETVSSSDGRSYTLSMADGMWMATFMGPSVSVTLGTHGGMVSIVTAEDGTYWVGDLHLMDGGTVSGDGGRMYTLSMGEDGQWMATYVMPAAVTVELGSGAGTVQLQLIEDGSWWHGDTAVADGSEVQAANGNGVPAEPAGRRVVGGLLGRPDDDPGHGADGHGARGRHGLRRGRRDAAGVGHGRHHGRRGLLPGVDGGRRADGARATRRAPGTTARTTTRAT